MAVDFASAVSAYKSAAGMFPQTTALTAQSGESAAKTLDDGASFSGLIQDSLQQTLNAGRQSEKLSRLAIEGKADLRDVVMAVNNAESTLQTVIAVRDKVVSAYESIMRMPI
ncbi:flagellar hook-basal body complex protein FliE [Pararhodospirillum photometricum]|uniref:Flagellar hook-basal body complex protein FliE n=1 Tax=Pararhodospirillum photometricum DSM 122 TaxID=1150469 RepID=H6SJ44_PARPM|nr:flagellar hook-basal body complex protein FliE [Pararhodospirillum photometricum]CCG08009.1 Flagellar hook-basal body complex protein FliE [Pararhodospirillum photometricum DSM 122]